jgi:hypothetical protein
VTGFIRGLLRGVIRPAFADEIISARGEVTGVDAFATAAFPRGDATLAAATRSSIGSSDPTLSLEIFGITIENMILQFYNYRFVIGCC